MYISVCVCVCMYTGAHVHLCLEDAGQPPGHPQEHLSTS